MVSENKSNMFAAVAGVVVGAGAAIAGAIALSDKKNKRKIEEVIAKGQTIARNYARDVNEKANDTREIAEKTVSDSKTKAKNLVKVVKTAVKGVKNV